jgi:predicted kinase
MIVLMAGLPGTGKTTLACELASRVQRGRVLNKDEVRHALFSADEIEYSSRQNDFCLHVMLETAGQFLQRDPQRFVFLDGRTFSRRYQIDHVVNAAAAMHQSWRIIECSCEDELARERITEQSSSGAHPAGNRNFQLYLEVKSRFEAITLPKTVINTGQALQACVDQALAALQS